MAICNQPSDPIQTVTCNLTDEQITSVEDDTVSHSLWIAPDNWLPPGCTSMIECGRGAGGWIWDNYLQGFSSSGDPDGDGVLNPSTLSQNQPYWVYDSR